MPNDDNNSHDVFWKNFAGVFRFGRGLLGRSSIALVAVLALGFAAIWRLHTEALIVTIFVLGAILFLIWYFRAEKFASKNPLEALLEGGDYTAHHQMLLAAKGYPNGLPEAALRSPILGVTSSQPISTDGEQKS
jgi:hypothetical protein